MSLETRECSVRLSRQKGPVGPKFLARSSKTYYILNETSLKFIYLLVFHGHEFINAHGFLLRGSLLPGSLLPTQAQHRKGRVKRGATGVAAGAGAAESKRRKDSHRMFDESSSFFDCFA